MASDGVLMLTFDLGLYLDCSDMSPKALVMSLGIEIANCRYCILAFIGNRPSSRVVFKGIFGWSICRRMLSDAVLLMCRETELALPRVAPYPVGQGHLPSTSRT